MTRTAGYLAGLCGLLLCVGPSRGDYVLRVVEPETSGVYAYRSFGSGAGFQGASSRDSAIPTRADVGKSWAILDDSVDSERRFELVMENSGYGAENLGTTGVIPAGMGSPIFTPTPITFRIEGTAGETGPVSLRISSLYAEQLPPPGTPNPYLFSAAHFLNGASMPVSGDQTFTFLVGETFQYRANLSRPLGSPFGSPAPLASATFTTTLAVVLDAGSAVPEPGSLALIAVAGPVVLLSVRRRRRHARKRG